MRQRKNLARIALAVCCVLLLVPGEMLSMAGVQPDQDELLEAGLLSAAGLSREAELIWEGGGPLRLFEDDMSPATATHFQSMGVEDYYGGAVPASGSGPAMWRHEPIRYGIDGRTDLDPWRTTALSDTSAAWQFGRTTSEGVEYPRIGGESGVVTPMIDLRSVPKIDESRDFTMESGQFILVDEGINLEESQELSEAAAALRLRHAYDFRLDGPAPLDGGRLEYTVYDPAKGWSSWEGLEPVDDALRIGEETITARRVAPTDDLVSMEARVRFNLDIDEDEITDPGNLIPDVPDPTNPSVPGPDDAVDNIQDLERAIEVDYDVEGNASHEGASDDSDDGRQGDYVRAGTNETGLPEADAGQINETTPPPWRYRGFVASSDIDRTERWRGFGGASDGLVESVFDLSQAAGHLVRLRFVVASDHPADPAFPWVPFGGWLVDAFQVNAVGQPRLDIVGLASPGDGAVIDPDSEDGPDFPLQAIVHNPFSTPLDARVDFALESGQSSSTSVSMGAGATGRVLATAPESYNEIGAPREGLQRVEVTATPTSAVTSGSTVSDAFSGVGPDKKRFHFVFGPGGGPDGRDWEVFDFQIVPDGDPIGTRNVVRDQPIEIRATLRNLASNITTVRLDEEGLHPVFRDIRGNKIGPAEPLGGGKVELGVSRDVSGSLGAIGAEVEVNWMWPGFSEARPVEVFLETGSGDIVVDGGRILVESVDPPAAMIEVGNPWNFGDDGAIDGSPDSHPFVNDCIRLREWRGREGVVRCGPDDSLVSPVIRVTAGELAKGDNMTLEVMHRGSAFEIDAYHEPSVPDPGISRNVLELYDEELRFQTFQADGSPDEWKTSEWNVTLPEGCTREGNRGCSLFLAFRGLGEGDWRLAEVQHGIDGLPFPGGWETFRVGLQAQEVNLEAQDGQFVWLHGRDNWASGISIGTSNLELDQGDVFLPVLEPDALTQEDRYYPSGRLVEVSELELGSIYVNGAKPVLGFSHWYDLGTGGRATVEVARDGEGMAGEWTELGSFEGTLGASPDFESIFLNLHEYSGEEVRLRFLYTIDLHADLQWKGWGWFVDQIRLEEQTGEGFVVIDLMDMDAGDRHEMNVNRTDAFNPNVDSGATVSHSLSGTKVHLEFSDQMNPCATMVRPNQYGRGPVVVTDPIDLRTAREPVLSLSHEGKIFFGSRARQAVDFDLEYQVLGSDGQWPTTWTRATPNDIRSWWELGNRTAFAEQAIDDHPDQTLRDPTTGGSVGEPFYLMVREDEGVWHNEFDLESLVGELVRFRLNAWSIWLDDVDDLDGTDSRARTNCIRADHLDWSITRFVVGEKRHFLDAAVNAIRLDQDRDDGDMIRRVDPEASSVVGDAAVVSNDQFSTFVTVANDGSMPLDEVRVRLEANFLGEGSARNLDILAIGPDGRPSTNTNEGRVLDLGRGEEREQRFHIDASRARPGEYLLTAVVEPLDGEDTNPNNDIQHMRLIVAPVRLLDLDEAESTVTPFAGTPTQERAINVQVFNRGNVPEGEVIISADLVERDGLTSVTPVELPGGPLEPLTRSLDRRGGVSTVSWTLTGEDLVDPATGQPVLDAGGAYAIRVSVDPTSDSTKSWWTDARTPLVPTQNSKLLGVDNHIVDISRAREFLLPFLVEDSIYRDDFGDGHRSLVEHEFPAGGPPKQTWKTQTRVDGEILGEDDRPWISRWGLVDVVGVAAEGDASGNSWFLPRYEGVEAVEQILVSPPLPSHVVSASSRAILDLQYAHELADGQAIIESRKLQWDEDSGDWVPRTGPDGEWQAIDAMRNQRVAVVLPPDFPRVTGTWIEPHYPITITGPEERPSNCHFYGGTRPGFCQTERTSTGIYENRTVQGHPWPPFYAPSEGSGWEPTETEGPDTHPNNWRAWSPFPADGNGDPEWEKALADTLRELANEFGPENVGVFTQPADDFGLDIGPEAWDAPRLKVERDGPGTYEFPVEELESLGIRLGSYGAILLMGDNATTTHASLSDHIRRMSHNETNAYNVSQEILGDLDHPWLAYHHRLHEILREAGPSGVRVVGAIGPASAKLALSGTAAGEELAVWTNPGALGETFLDSGELMFHSGQVRCLVDNRPDSQSPGYQDLGAERDRITQISIQPLEMCEWDTGQSQPAPGTRREPAPDLPFNYYYVSPQDARALALLDFLAIGNADWAGPDAGVVQSRQRDGPLFITAGQAHETGGWLEAVKQGLGHASGALPGGTGAWEALPPSLAFNFGGEFERGPEGDERYVGNPAQFRIRIHSDADQGGHGFFALDRFGILGSPAQQDVSIRFLEPEDLGEYSPGSPFQVLVEATNRGLDDSPPLFADMRITQPPHGACPDDGGDPTCGWAEIVRTGQWIRENIPIDILRGGGQRVIAIPLEFDEQRDNTFPNAQPDEANKDKGPSAFRFIVEIKDFPAGFNNQDPFNNRSVVEAMGVRRVAAAIEDLRVDPPVRAFETEESLRIKGRLVNLGSLEQAVTLEVRLQQARSLDCIDPVDPEADPVSGPYRACDPWKDPPELLGGPIELSMEELQLPRRGVHHFTIEVDDLEDAGLQPGVWLVVVQAMDMLGADTVPLDRQVRWLNLVDETVEPDRALSNHFMNIAGTGSLPVSEPVAAFRGADKHSSDSQVPPPGLDFAVEGGALVVGDERHRGAFGDNPATRHENVSLKHGWLLQDDQQRANPFFEGNHLIWTRSSQATDETGRVCDDRSASHNDCGRNWNRQDLADRGRDDFGEDWIVWQPELTPDGAPFSLASHEEPVLRLLSRHQVTQNTGLIVEAQVAKRVCSNDANDGDSPEEPDPCVWEWHWGEGQSTSTRGDAKWVPLSGTLTRDAPSNLGVVPLNCNSSGESDDRQYWCDRLRSNPLAGKPGIWGGQSQGEHRESGAWEILEYDVTPLLDAQADTGGPLHRHCVEARDSHNSLRQRTLIGGGVSDQFPWEHRPSDSGYQTPMDDPCRYAWSNGYWGEDEKSGEPIPRPIRFRFVAASSGVDEGVNRWEIAGASLSDHRLRFESNERELLMTDNDAQVVPFRLENPSRVQDQVRVSWSFPPDHSFGDEVQVLLGRTPVGPFHDDITLTMSPRSTSTVYVRIEVGLEHGLSPGQHVGLPVLVEARSLHDPTALAMGLVEGTFTTQAWANLDISCLAVGIDDACEQTARVSVGEPVSVTVAWRNRGEVPAGNETHPVLLRLMEERIEDGKVVSSRPALDAQGKPSQRLIEETVRPSRSNTHTTLEWHPPEEGHYRIIAEINLPREDDGIVQFPESDYRPNRLERDVAIGAVPLSDLRIRDAWLESFETGERVDRLIDGHLYVVNADVVNQGQAAARDFATEFRVGAADPFSRISRDDYAGEHHRETLTSTPWQARLHTDGSALWTFAVDVSTITPEASVEGKSFLWDARVDSYSLRVSDAPRNVDLVPGQEVRIPVNVTNTGNAPAVPLASLPAGAEGVNAHLSGSHRFEPGETQTTQLVLVVDDGLVEGTEIPPVELGVREDPLLTVSLPLAMQVVGEGPARAAAHPLISTPGHTRVSLGLGNDGNTDAVWRIVDAAAPLDILEWATIVAPFDTKRVEADIRVRNGTLPGTYPSQVELEVETDGEIRRLNVSVVVQVEPEPRFGVRVLSDDQTVPLGRAGSVLLQVSNPGNVPIQTGVEHSVDDGSLKVLNKSIFDSPLEPGQTRTQEVRVEPPHGARQVLGLSNATWAWLDGNASGLQEVEWRVAYEERRVRITSAGLDGLEPRSGHRNEVAVTVENPMDRSVEAEVLLLLDGTVHGVSEVTLDPQGRSTIHLVFQPGEEGEGHDLMVMARPAGSTANPTDSVYFEIGDAESRYIVTGPPVQEHGFAPGLTAWILVLTFLGLMGVIRWRRR